MWPRRKQKSLKRTLGCFSINTKSLGICENSKGIKCVQWQRHDDREGKGELDLPVELDPTKT